MFSEIDEDKSSSKMLGLNLSQAASLLLSLRKRYILRVYESNTFFACKNVLATCRPFFVSSNYCELSAEHWIRILRMKIRNFGSGSLTKYTRMINKYSFILAYVRAQLGLNFIFYLFILIFS